MFIKELIRSFVKPAPSDYRFNFFKYILLTPRLYSLVSFVLQYIDQASQKKIVHGNEKDQHFKKVYDYNAKVTLYKGISTTRRPEEYFKFIEAIPKRHPNEKILLIGPRNIFELYLAWLHGFKWGNIFAIDLFSTNKKILIMNMESMTFPSESFDYIFMSRVYGYAKDPEKCISEASRVLKDKGCLIFEANYFPEDQDWPTNHLPGKITVGFLQKHKLYITGYRYFEKTNALGKRQGTHKLCATKDLDYQQRLDPFPFL